MSERRLLLSREFRLVWWGQVIAQVGDGVSRLALLWFVYAITGSPLKTTVIGLLQTVPPIVFGPLVGVLVDRIPKKAVLVGSDLVRAAVIGLIPCLMAVESFTVERLYVLVFLQSIASALFLPALTASVPVLVAPRQFTAANALLQTTTSLGVIVGPALSGLGIAALSSQEVLCLNAVTYVVSAACFLAIRFPRVASARPGGSPGSPMTTAAQDLLEGLRFAFFVQPVILALTLAAGGYSFGTAAFSTLFPVIGRKMLDLGPVEVGYLWSLYGVGLLLMSLVLIQLSGWELPRRLRVLSISSAICGVALWGLAWAPDRLTAGLLMVLIGTGAGALTPIAWGVLQEVSPAQMAGRVLALYTTGAMASAITGMTVFGWITQEFGVRPGVTGIGLVLLATGLLAVGLTRWVGAGRGQPVPAPSFDQVGQA